MITFITLTIGGLLAIGLDYLPPVKRWKRDIVRAAGRAALYGNLDNDLKKMKQEDEQRLNKKP